MNRAPHAVEQLSLSIYRENKTEEEIKEVGACGKIYNFA